MSLGKVLSVLKENPEVGLNIQLPSGETIPPHFHVTEVAQVTKEFVDCGGTLRKSIVCMLQIWVANDYDHRLNSTKLSKILSYYRGNDFSPVEIEYEKDGVTSIYEVVDLQFVKDGLLFVLDNKHTGCLSPDKCGVR